VSSLVGAAAPASAAGLRTPDLTIAMNATPNPVTGGNLLTHTLGVSNTSVECRGGSLAMDDYATITIVVRAQTYASTINATAKVDPLNEIAERSETNNSASFSTTVNPYIPPPPSLLLTSHVSGPTSASVGQTVTYTVNVDNNSVAASNVETWFEAGLGYTLRGVHSSNFSCAAGSGMVVVDCSGGSMPTGGTDLTYSVDITFNNAGCTGLTAVLDPNGLIPGPKQLSATPLQVCVS